MAGGDSQKVKVRDMLSADTNIACVSVCRDGDYSSDTEDDDDDYS